MMSDPFGILIPVTNRNLGLNAACIWFKTLRHLDVVPLVFEVDSELGDGDTMEDFIVVDGGDEAKGDGVDGIIKVLLGCQCCEGCLV